MRESACIYFQMNRFLEAQSKPGKEIQSLLYFAITGTSWENAHKSSGYFLSAGSTTASSRISRNDDQMIYPMNSHCTGQTENRPNPKSDS